MKTDWNTLLDTPIENTSEWLRLTLISKDWNQCAVGQLTGIQRTHGNVPSQPELYNLGHKFSMYITYLYNVVSAYKVDKDNEDKAAKHLSDFSEWVTTTKAVLDKINTYLIK